MIIINEVVQVKQISSIKTIGKNVIDKRTKYHRFSRL